MPPGALPVPDGPWPGTVRPHLIWPAFSRVGGPSVLSSDQDRDSTNKLTGMNRAISVTAAQPAAAVSSFRPEINACITFSTSGETSALYGPLVWISL